MRITVPDTAGRTPPLKTDEKENIQNISDTLILILMKHRILAYIVTFFCLSGMLHAQTAVLLHPYMNDEESDIYEQDADRYDAIAKSVADEQMTILRDYYSDRLQKRCNALYNHLLTWATHEEVCKTKGNYCRNGSYLTAPMLAEYREKYFELLFQHLDSKENLLSVSLPDKYIWNLTADQRTILQNAIIEISAILSRYTDEQLFGSSATAAPTKTLRYLRFHDQKIMKALAVIDTTVYNRLRDIDHYATINALNKKQFQRIIFHTYHNIDKDIEKIWNLLDSAKMVHDKDRIRDRYYIRKYLIDLKTVEELYWNDKIGRQTARHAVKVQAPPVIKRYFSLRPKKKKENPSQKREINYLW